MYLLIANTCIVLSQKYSANYLSLPDSLFLHILRSEDIRVL